ncbi:MAG: PHP domain-containing protein [Nannocystales bacterium]
MRLDEDMHVHSTYSDGRNTVEEVIDVAKRRGLRRIGFADHVRASTSWIPAYVNHLQRARRWSGLEVVIGVESKLLDTAGSLDMPADATGIERVLVADHRLPIGDELLGPREVRERLAEGVIQRAEVWSSLLTAYEACASSPYPLQLAHPLSFLAKVGIPEAEVPLHRLDHLAGVLAARDVLVEVSERWRCPSPSTLAVFAQAGVQLVASTDAHDMRSVGRYEFVRCLDLDLA